MNKWKNRYIYIRYTYNTYILFFYTPASLFISVRSMYVPFWYKYNGYYYSLVNNMYYLFTLFVTYICQLEKNHF